jgi:hypothetical protein
MKLVAIFALLVAGLGQVGDRNDDVIRYEILARSCNEQEISRLMDFSVEEVNVIPFNAELAETLSWANEATFVRCEVNFLKVFVSASRTRRDAVIKYFALFELEKVGCALNRQRADSRFRDVIENEFREFLIEPDICLKREA